MQLARLGVYMSDGEFEVEVGFWLCCVHSSVPNIENKLDCNQSIARGKGRI